MPGYAWVLGVRSGYAVEYLKRHDESFFETDDLETTKAALRASPVDKRWSEWMAPIMKIEVDPQTQTQTQTQFPDLLPKQFYME